MDIDPDDRPIFYEHKSDDDDSPYLPDHFLANDFIFEHPSNSEKGYIKELNKLFDPDISYSLRVIKPTKAYVLPELTENEEYGKNNFNTVMINPGRIFQVSYYDAPVKLQQINGDWYYQALEVDDEKSVTDHPVLIKATDVKVVRDY